LAGHGIIRVMKVLYFIEMNYFVKMDLVVLYRIRGMKILVLFYRFQLFCEDGFGGVF